MYGAILGDIIGSPYEFDQGEKTKDFPLFSKDSTFTDDSVMTLAVAEALMNTVEACGRHFARTGGTGLMDVGIHGICAVAFYCCSVDASAGRDEIHDRTVGI